MVRADKPSWYNVWGRTSSSNVVPAGRIGMYHSLHIQYLQRSSWGWTVTVRNMYSWHLSIYKHLISATTLCISLECIYILKKWYRTFKYQGVVDSHNKRWHVTFLAGCCQQHWPAAFHLTASLAHSTETWKSSKYTQNFYFLHQQKTNLFFITVFEAQKMCTLLASFINLFIYDHVSRTEPSLQVIRLKFCIHFTFLLSVIESPPTISSLFWLS